MASLLDKLITYTVDGATKKATTKTGAANQSLGGRTSTMSALGTAYQGGSDTRRMGKSIVTGVANGALGMGLSAFSSGASKAQPSGGYSGGGYGGYGGGSSGPTDEQKDAAKALSGLAAAQAQAAKDKFNNVKDAMDKANANAKKTMEATGHVIGRTAAGEWYHNALENPQKTAAAILGRVGNAALGSMRLSFMDDFQRVFDDATVASITNELQQKQDNIYEYTQTVNKNIQEINKMAADTEAALAAGVADYISQLINIHPDLVKGGKDSIGKFVDTKALDKIKTGTSTKNAAKTIKVPEYLKYSGFYNENKGNLITPSYLTQVRPDNARDNARSLNTTSRGNIASAANPEYIQALTTPYGQRNH